MGKRMRIYEIDEYRNLHIPENLRKYMGKISREAMKNLIKTYKYEKSYQK